jgi:hypothetical protein
MYVDIVLLYSADKIKLAPQNLVFTANTKI